MSKRSPDNPYAVIDDPAVRMVVYREEGKKVPVRERAKWWLGILGADPEVKRMVTK